jgi:hypothetical protein
VERFDLKKRKKYAQREKHALNMLSIRLQCALSGAARSVPSDRFLFKNFL